MDCGPQSLQYALRRDGRGARLSTLIAECRAEEDNGTWTASMLRVLQDRGYEAWVESDVTWERVAELLPSHHLFISWWTIFFPDGETGNKGGAHWSVITKVSDEKVWMWDPSYETTVVFPRATVDAFWLAPERHGEVLHSEVRTMVVAIRRPLPRKKPKKNRRSK